MGEVKNWSEDHRKSVSTIITRHTYHMKFLTYMAVLFITFFHVHMVLFVSLYIWVYVVYVFV